MRTLTLAAVLAASTARAQPVTSPDAIPPLAQIHDDKQLAEIIASITQDPAIRVDDDKARVAAQALMTEGVRRLQVQAYDQALANFLEAYNKFPSPKILLNIASTLRDMGRTADAANTYQRYLTDPATGAERVAEVKELLIKLDAELTILTVHVFPRGSEVSIDGGPFVSVGSSLQTRVRPGPHTVRIRHAGIVSSTDLTSFDGETRDVNVQITNDVKSEEPAPPTPPPPPPANAPPPPENGQGWLIGRGYATADGNSRERRTLETPSGPPVKPYMPPGGPDLEDAPPVFAGEDKIGSGVVGIVRIDGNHWRGFAGGLGLAYAVSDPFEVEVAGLKSDVWGAYVGARYRFLTGWLRPYGAAGIPMFFFTDDMMGSHVALGGRIAGGIELRINGHLSVQADLGIEHFFNIGGVVYKMQTFEETAFTPTIGVIGRL
jgi:hypothetical protein